MLAGTPVKRTGRNRFVRNVLIAIGNSGDATLVPEAMRLLGDPSPLVRGAAVWASENVWNSWDAASLLAQSHQPLLLTMDCLNGYFVAPSYDSLAESLTKADGRGAIAAFSPRLNEAGNSVRSLNAIRDIAGELGVGVFGTFFDVFHLILSVTSKARRAV